MNKAAEIVRTEMDRRHHQRFGSSMGLSEDEGPWEGMSPNRAYNILKLHMLYYLRTGDPNNMTTARPRALKCAPEMG